MPKEIKPELNPHKGLNNPTTKRQIAEVSRYAVKIAEIAYRETKEFDKKLNKQIKANKTALIVNALLSTIIILLTIFTCYIY